MGIGVGMGIKLFVYKIERTYHSYIEVYGLPNTALQLLRNNYQIVGSSGKYSIVC